MPRAGSARKLHVCCTPKKAVANSLPRLTEGINNGQQNFDERRNACTHIRKPLYSLVCVLVCLRRPHTRQMPDRQQRAAINVWTWLWQQADTFLTNAHTYTYTYIFTAKHTRAFLEHCCCCCCNDSR